MIQTIGYISKKYNISVQTLHYYEKEGLLPPIQKDESGKRIYTDKDLEWLDLICCFRNAGMKIHEIKEYMLLCRAGKHTMFDRYQIIKQKKQDILQQIQKLEKAYDIICEKEAYYQKRVSDNQDAINPATRK